MDDTTGRSLYQPKFAMIDIPITSSSNILNTRYHSVFTIDVEDWFHILDSPAAPKLADWDSLESTVAANTEKILAVLDEFNIKATFFWLGWVAERNKNLVNQCLAMGHEIASHGYAHVLAYKVGRNAFGEDVRRGKKVLEDIIGREVTGFRTAGFSIKKDDHWTFEEICSAGYIYDSSVFPAVRNHGGMSGARLEPYLMKTLAGELIELPQSMIELFWWRVSFFGGGYLRLAPQWLINWGIRKLENAQRPLIVYIHPREIDPYHPRLPLGPVRRFKCYVNIDTTLNKLRQLCSKHKFVRMMDLASQVVKHEATTKNCL